MTPPHPDETEYDPYRLRKLRSEPETQFKRELVATAQNIQSTEARLKKLLRQIGESTPHNLLQSSVNKQDIMVRKPHLYPRAEKAISIKGNLRRHYKNWANLCKKHDQAKQSQKEAN